MHAMLSSYISLLLLFTMLFSSKSHRHETQKHFSENKIVPFIPQSTPVKLYDYFIYLSNDKFKNDILPFLSSEILLKIYFYFRNLDPNVSIKKFLPESRFRVKTTVLDLQKSYYPAYIFKNEFSCFNPIIFDPEQNNYRTVNLGRRDNNTEEDSIYALFLSNKIFSFESYDLYHNQKVFAAFDETDHFFTAEQKIQEKLTVISYGINPINFSNIIVFDYLDSILKAAHDLNYFKTFYFKVFDLYDKYQEYLFNTRWCCFVFNVFDRGYPYDFSPAKILDPSFRVAFLYIGYFPIYHVQMLPFYIVSFPLKFFLFQYNSVIFGIISKNFVWFWILPCSFRYIAYLLYFQLQFFIEDFRDIELKPKEIKRALPYFIGKKYLPGTSRQALFKIFQFLLIFSLGFIYTLPLFPFMIIQGETNE